MKVLLVATLYPMHSADPTGAFVAGQARALRRIGVDVRVLVPLPYAPPGAGRRRERWMAGRRLKSRDEATFATLAVPRASSLTARLFANQSVWNSPGIIEQVRAWLGPWAPDVIHAHQALPEGQLARALASRASWSPRFVATLHGADLHSTRPGALSALGRELAVQDRVVVATARMARQVKDIAPGASIAVIPPGLEPPPEAETDDRNLGPPFDVVSVGRLVRIKAMQRLFPLAAAGYSVAIAGDGPERRHLERGAPAGVEFVGPLAPPEVAEFICRGRVYAQVSEWDGYGLAAAEAMDLGRPVVLSRDVGLSDYVTDGLNGLIVDAGRPEALLRTTRSLLVDSGRAKLMAVQGRLLIAGHRVDSVAHRLSDEVYRVE